jgi:hypothetical protein
MVLVAALVFGCSSSSRPTLPGLGQVVANPNGFGGYFLRGLVRELSAAWVVPAIAPGSPAGLASTWIGARTARGDFIQVGTTEDKGASTGVPAYRVFWSDTSLQFHARYLADVAVGDAIEARMVQDKDGWQLSLRDAASNVAVTKASGYGAGLRFDDAQYIQEDPATYDPSVDAPYPTMMTTSFTSVEANKTPAQLSYREASVLSSPNQVFLVPTRPANGGFELLPATALPAQYLRDIQQLNATHTQLRAALAGDAPGFTGQEEGEFDIPLLRAAAAQAPAQDWPPTVVPLVRRLAVIWAQEAADLQAWDAAGAPANSAPLRAAEADQASGAKTGQAIRTTIGLPPL